MKLNILAIAAHPDDVELGCAGTLLAHLAKGDTVGILDLTRGELGTRGTPEIRAAEAAAAAQILGIQVRDNVGLADGFFRMSMSASAAAGGAPNLSFSAVSKR